MLVTRILITGSRDWRWRQLIEAALDRAVADYGDPWAEPFEYQMVEVMHGAARGADQIAASVARARGWVDCPYPVTSAQWRASRGAGYARNADMVARGADICLAFIKHNSAGSTHCLNLAQKAGIPCRVYRLPLIIPRRVIWNHHKETVGRRLASTCS